MATTIETRAVVVRSHKAGVYMGYLAGESDFPGFIRLRARHMWRWEQALGTCGLAIKGPGPGTSSPGWVEIDIATDDICALITATPEAMAALEGLEVSNEEAR